MTIEFVEDFPPMGNFEIAFNNRDDFHFFSTQSDTLKDVLPLPDTFYAEANIVMCRIFDPEKDNIVFKDAVPVGSYMFGDIIYQIPYHE